MHLSICRRGVVGVFQLQEVHPVTAGLVIRK